MEILTAADARFPVEDGELIDFGIDEGEAKDEEEEEEEDEYEHLTSFFKGDSGSSTSPMEYLIPAETTTEAAAFSGETVAGSFPEFMEEDLEWLSNKDAFPGVETCFGILSENPELIMKHHSPISVLEHNTTSTTTTTTTTTTNSNTTINASNVTSCCDSFRVPTNHPVRPRTKRRRCKRVVFGDLSSWSNQVTLKNKQESSPLLFPLPSTKSGSTMGRRCLHCRTDKTPQWRAGPMGPKTLCNACGVRYKSGRLLPEYRPASSPTFSSALHSNSHRKVVEMRRQKQLPVATDLGVSTKF